ncbi:MAG: RsmE family RNA methyltransferase [Candidatus Aceula meridiana]|nr:RsmE family RNA methyltransferase [Candidatus Aceula meridiana]
MHRAFLKTLTTNQKTVTLADSSEIHHIKRVLRLKAGDAITLFNGQGIEAKGKISSFSKNCVQIKIEKITSEKHTGPILTLACAIPKKAKFQTIIEKCTELEIDEIIPLATKRTEVRLNELQAQKKLIRYQSVAINAAKQSKRKTIPVILPVADLKGALQQIDKNTIAFIGCLDGNRKLLKSVLTEELKEKGRIIFFIGPEGDFTSEEIKSAIDSGCIPIDLGKTVLKVDTAAISVVSFARLLLYS